MNMRATVILRDKTDVFWNGGGVFPGPGFLTQTPAEQWARCVKLSHDGMATVKIGHCDAFRDKVELNQLLRGPHTVTCKIEPRRGYKLAVFEFSKA